MWRLLLIGLLGAGVACAAPQTQSAGARVLSRGGALDVTSVPEATIERGPAGLVVWAQLELAPEARVQAALAAVDAQARAGLASHLRTEVASLMLDRSGTSVDAVTWTTLEKSAAQLAGPLVPLHGWAIVETGASRALHVAARLEVPRAVLAKLLAEVPLFAPQHLELLDALLAEAK